MTEIMTVDALSSMLNDAANNTEEDIKSTAPSRMFFDDVDDLDDLDDSSVISETQPAGNSNAFADDLDDLDDLDDIESEVISASNPDAITQSESYATSADAVERTVNVQSKLISARVFEGDKVFDYTEDIRIAVPEKDDVKATTILEDLTNKMDAAFMITNPGGSFLNLWNANFIASKATDEYSAFIRLVAMFYHVDFTDVHVGSEVLNDGTMAFLSHLQSLNHIIRLHDVREPEPTDDIADIANESEDGAVDLTENVSLSENQAPASNIKPVTATIPDKKLSKKALRKIFIEKLTQFTFTDKILTKMTGVPKINQCFIALQDLYYQGDIDACEFVKFTCFLVNTREIILDIATVKKAKTFNRYWATLLFNSKKQTLDTDSDVLDSVFILSAQNKVTEVFVDYIATNWRLFQLQIRLNTAIMLKDVNGGVATVISMPGIVELPRINYVPKNSSYTIFANAFVNAFGESIKENTLDSFKWLSPCDELSLYNVRSHGLAIPANFAKAKLNQKALLEVVIEHLVMQKSPLLQLLLDGKIKEPWGIRTATLVNDYDSIGDCNVTVSLTYQLISYALVHEGKCEIHLKKVTTDGQPTIVMLGDGVIQGTKLSLDEFIFLYDQIAEHIRLSSLTEISVIGTELQIKFNK